MTIEEAIKSVNSLKPNNYTDSEKIKWLSSLDQIIKTEIIDRHEGWEEITFDGYSDTTPTTTQLLAPAGYDDLYLYWLESRIDYYNAEYAKYNNSITAFNTAYSSLERYYNREHMPLGTKIKYF